MKKFRTALVVGRFQPFHKGHLYLIKKALKYADKLLIAVGSSNVSNEDNPLSYEVRKRMLKKVLSEEKFRNKVVKIVPSPDHPNDDVWFKLLLKNTGRAFDVEIGNNNWVNGIFEKKGFKVIRVPYYRRNIYQGIYIRELFTKSKRWENRVPKYLTDTIKQEFEATINT